MKFTRKLFRYSLIAFVLLFMTGLLVVTAVYFYITPQLPSVEVLRDVRFQVPLQVYTQQNQLIAEYGSKKRDPLKYEQIPRTMIQAVLAAEDDRFFEHPGVDYQGLLRAVFNLLMTGEKAQGGSTITMQVARNFFLSSEKTYLRKLNEIFLSFKIERELTKTQILELYLNKIFLGNRAYGVGSAAKIYYGKPIQELDLAQYAMLAGLPKAPSTFNPIANPERALIRRNYVLGRMLTLGHISQEEYETARAEPVSAKLSKEIIDVDAPYLGEMVRSYMYEQYGEEAYDNGYKVYVTIDPRLQLGAQAALQQTLLEYEYRHGFRGPLEHIEYSAETEPEEYLRRLDQLPTVGQLQPALVTATEDQRALALLADGREIAIEWEGLSWAARYLDTNYIGDPPQQADKIVTPGDIVYLLENAPDHWRLAQIPNVAGAIISLDPKDGAILALSGGFDFFHSKFNRATQARRQPGSSFKPFIYSAALENGFSTASIVNDAPVVFDDPGLETSWRPENYSGRIYGPTRLREALTHSRNLVSIRLLQAIGIPYAIEYVKRFGFDPARLPRDLSLSLGSAAVTPLELASGYSIFANGGFRIESYFIQRIEDSSGNVIMATAPQIACLDCEKTRQENIDAADTGADQVLARRVITPQNAYLMTSMMRDVVRYGTARRAMQLGRNDLAGKTGTTNDQRDAWFAGFNANLVTISWIGFDDGKPLGDRETGGRAALPMWISFMKDALSGKPETPLEQPEGMTTVRIDPKTGLLASPSQQDAIFETFRSDEIPTRRAPVIDESVSTPDSDSGEDLTPQLLF